MERTSGLIRATALFAISGAFILLGAQEAAEQSKRKPGLVQKAGQGIKTVGKATATGGKATAKGVTVGAKAVAKGTTVAAGAVKTTAVGKRDPYRDPQVIMTAQSKLQQKGYYSGAIDGVAGPRTQSGMREFQGDNQLQATGKLNPRTAKALGVDIPDPRDVSVRKPGLVQKAGQGAKTVGKATAKGATVVAKTTAKGATVGAKGVATGGKATAKGATVGAKAIAKGATVTASAVKTTMVGKKDPYSNSEVIMTAQRKLQAKGYYSGVVDGIAGPQTQSGLREFQGDEKLKVTGRLNKATAKALEMDLVR